MKDELCKAFCNQLAFREVPAGLAVRTGFDLSDSEPLGFYIVGPDSSHRYRIEDGGRVIPSIEAAGADLESQTRLEAFETMLREAGATYNEESGELTTYPLESKDVPQAALRFVALLLRLQDLILLTPERAASTFKEDATRAIKESLGERAKVRENEPIAPGVEFPADIILEAPGRTPVAVFLAMSEQRVLEAVVAQMAALYESHSPCAVMALLEKETTIPRKLLRHAANRLVGLPVFEGDEKVAIQRIEREVFGTQKTVH